MTLRQSGSGDAGQDPLRRDPLLSIGSLHCRIGLAEFGDACQAAGDLPAAVEAWQQALQVLDDLGWPDLLRVGARLEQAGAPSPPA